MPAQNDPPRILMCPPDHFAVTYKINPWMDPALWRSQAESFAREAQTQWQGLARRLTALGAVLELVPAEPALPDLVFTANAAVVMDGTVLLAHFRHPERQGEEAAYARNFEGLQERGLVDAIRPMPDGLFLEGAGDCVWDRFRKLFWMGCGPRSERDAARVVAETFGLEVVALELVDPRFYHMDTALSALPRGEIMFEPQAFDDRGLREIAARTTPEQRLELSPEDAAVFAANAVWLGNQVVMSDCSAALRRGLEERGYDVHPTPLSAFHLSGGSSFCLTLRLNHRS